MGFIERFRTLCGGSRALAWLLTVTAGSALLLWIVGLAAGLTGHAGDGPGLWLGVPSDITLLPSRPWTLLTYMLVHTNPLHLLFNLLWLYWFGRMLADVASDRQMLWIFVGSGVAGGMLYSVSSAFGGYTGAYLAGDSAAVLGVMAATALLMPSRRIGLFLIGEVKLKWVALACILLTLLGSGGGVAPQAAHIGGALAGGIWALVRKGYIRPPQTRTRRNRGRKVNAKATIRAINRSISDSERLDQLLDKIRVSGYESLSAREKAELNHISSRIED